MRRPSGSVRLAFAVRLPVAVAVTVMVSVAGCRGLPIDWSRGDYPDVGPDTPVALRDLAGRWEASLFSNHLSEEGLLLYRAPAEPHPVTGRRRDLADQACWSGYLLAALASQHACEPDAATRDRIHRVLGGLALLHDVTGVEGLIARCVVPAAIAPHVANHPEDWRDGAVPGFAWRGDASKDQYSGYVLGLAAAAALVDDAEVRRECGRLLGAIARHLDARGLRIHGVGADGTVGAVTRFGDMRPRIFGVAVGVNAAIVLAALEGAAVYGDDPALAAIAARHRGALVGALHRLHFELFSYRNYSNDQMAAGAVTALALLPGVALRPELRRHWESVRGALRGEGNAYVVAVSALLGLRDAADERGALRNLALAGDDPAIRELPAERFTGVERRWLDGRKGRPRSRHALPLPLRDRTSFVWRSDPYTIDRAEGARGEVHVSLVDLYVAYWLGRLSGWLPAPPKASS